MNAKELILKKINADANWVDIYVGALIQGESLKSISGFMMDPDIVKVCDRYSSSIFDIKQNFDKKQYLLEQIKAEEDPEIVKKYSKLLEKVKQTEELQFLGKILKINQGLPTNTTDLYSYIKSIEKFVETILNKELYNTYLELTADYEYEKSKWLTPEIQEQLDSGRVSMFDIAPSAFKNILKRRSKYIEDLQTIWENFNLIRFIKDNEYAESMINKYEENKRIFNILRVIKSVPHFSQMFNALAVNKDILNILSVRNATEDIILNQLWHNYESKPNVTKKLSSKEVTSIKNRINRMFIDSWILSKNISIPDTSITVGNKVMIPISTFESISTLRKYIEDYVIPLLKKSLPDNIFIQSLALGIKFDERTKVQKPFWKLPFNMIQIDSNSKTLDLYEKCLSGFNDLQNVKLRDLDINPVDLLYLYNLIVNDDKFGQTSLTRIFEDLISSAQGDTLLLNDFNNWIDKQDPNELARSYFAEYNLSVQSISITQEPKEPLTKLVEDTQLDLFKAYDTEPSIKSKLINLVKTTNIPGLNIVFDEDLVDEDDLIRSSKGFIDEGEIYINADRATDDTVIHEFGHLYLASAKREHPKEYYNLLIQVKNTETWKTMRQLPEYQNKQGSDFDEEILATILSKMYNNTLSSDEIDIAKEVMKLVPTEYKEFIESDVLPTLDETFISNYKLDQKVATLKNKLFKQETIKENCK